MTKKMIWVEESIDFEGKVLHLIECLQALLEKHGEDAYVEIQYNYENTDYVLKFQREETDREYNTRLKAEDKEKENKLKALEKKREKERKEYERLKKVYGD